MTIQCIGDKTLKKKTILFHMGKGPDAIARLQGSSRYPQLKGVAEFFQTKEGVLVSVDVTGLPKGEGPCESPVFALHIHSGGRCSGNETDPFADAMTHYNPYQCLHPYHAGDLPPLFGVNGTAFSLFLTGRFTVQEVLGKSVIIHAKPDDFTTQPSGNAGEKMACGIIIKRGR